MKLSWTAAAGASKYYVYMGKTAGGESATAVATVTGTSTEITDLGDFTKYYFKVKAADAAGLSPASNEASATTTL